jgi:hypothetical protein
VREARLRDVIGKKLTYRELAVALAPGARAETKERGNRGGRLIK